MFDKFGDYMYSLLFAPLKRVQKAANQFYIFFTMTGDLFDHLKTVLAQLREESSILTCSEALLQIHGQDRDMSRLAGEDIENYRTRLAMKGIIAAKAGTNEGIRYLGKSFGYDDVEIIPGDKPEHWAEATVTFVGGRIVLDNETLLLQELNKIKPARTLLHIAKEQRYTAEVYMGTAIEIGREITIRQG